MLCLNANITSQKLTMYQLRSSVIHFWFGFRVKVTWEDTMIVNADNN